MRHLVIPSGATRIEGDISTWTAGKAGFALIGSNGTPVAFIPAEEPNPATGSIKDIKYLVNVRSAKKGGPLLIPFNVDGLSFTRMPYSAGRVFSLVISSFGAPVAGKDYTIIVVDKTKTYGRGGKKSITYSATSQSTVAKMIKFFADSINKGFSETLGLVATYNATTLTSTGSKTNKDYEFILGDNLTATLTYTRPIKEIGTLDHIKELAELSVADRGITDTDNFPKELYPTYPLDIEEIVSGGNTQNYCIYTIFTKEGRKVKTTDTKINQIFQIATPTGSGLDTYLSTVLPLFVNYK